MRHERQLELLDRILGYVDSKSHQLAPEESRVPVSNYSIQSVLHAGANTHFRVGRIEHAIRQFHDSIDRALAEHPAPR